jgi:hypothetical protein
MKKQHTERNAECRQVPSLLSRVKGSCQGPKGVLPARDLRIQYSVWYGTVHTDVLYNAPNVIRSGPAATCVAVYTYGEVRRESRKWESSNGRNIYVRVY